MSNDTKELKKIRKELSKMTKVHAIIGQTIIEEKINTLQRNNKRFKELVKKIRSEEK